MKRYLLGAILVLAVFTVVFLSYPNRCPVCGSTSAIPIEYGKPLTNDKPGKGATGGCVVNEDSPRWICSQCGAKWGKIGKYGQ